MTYEEFKKRYTWDPRTDLLGQGGYGKVFRATDIEHQSKVAIKIAPVHVYDDKYSLLREYQLLCKIEPHINIALYDNCYRLMTDIGESDYAIAEYYPLGSLKKVLNTHKRNSTEINSTEKNEIIAGILNGLAHLHKLNIIHRDLKPDNILIKIAQERYIAKIADFGLSKKTNHIENSISQSFTGGSANYASPEQLKGEKVKLNTDLWSFGVILYELMTGEVPYRIDNMSSTVIDKALLLMRRQELPESFNQIKEPFATIVSNCLKFDPNERYENVQEIVNGLKGLPRVPPIINIPIKEEEDLTKPIPNEKPQKPITPPPYIPPKPVKPEPPENTWKTFFVIVFLMVFVGLAEHTCQSNKTTPKEINDSVVVDTTTAVDTAAAYYSPDDYLNAFDTYTPGQIAEAIQYHIDNDLSFKQRAINKFIEEGDKYYNNNDCANARACYDIVYSYEPTNSVIQERRNLCP